VLVEFLDDMLGWYTDSADEELSARVDDDVDELIEFALGVVVASIESVMRAGNDGVWCSYLVLRALPPTWGSNRSIPKGAFWSSK
jgi:hypothetical protein